MSLIGKKVGVLIRSYHLTEYLDLVIKQYAWCGRILVLNYKFPGVEESPDDTKKIALENNCEYLTGECIEQHQVFNLGLEKLKDCDCVFISDADEFLQRKDMDIIVELIQQYDAVLAKVIDYIDRDTILRPRDHHPIVAVNPKKVLFEKVRNYNGYNYTTDEIIMHHFGYAWKDKELDWKYKNKLYDSFNELMAQETESYPCPLEIRNAITINQVKRRRDESNSNTDMLEKV